MKLIFRLFLLAASNALALWVAHKLIPGIIFSTPDYVNFLKAGLVLGLINTFIAPVVKLITLPLRLLTLGFFTLVINVALLFWAAHFFDFFQITGIMAGVWGTLVISLVNYLISTITAD